MQGLCQGLVEHWLHIKPDFMPYKQKVRPFHADLISRIKDEIYRLFEANFIRPCRYTEWVSNSVSMERKVLVSLECVFISAI